MRNEVGVCKTLAFAGILAAVSALGLSAAAFAFTGHTAAPVIKDFSSMHSIAVTAASGGNNAAASSASGNSVLASGARNFIDTMAQRALGFLAGTGSQETKKSEFARLLQDSFDMETIGRFTLGRYWRVSTKQQREEYLKLFRQMVVDVYSARFSEYKGQRFDVRSVRQDGEKDAIVTSFIVPPEGPEVQVDWRVRYKDGRYKVVDVIVEGVSMSVTQRSDFSAVIQRGGGDVQVLLAHLRKQ